MPLYAIWAVRYDLDRSRILSVQVRAMEGERVMPAVELTREEFMALARQGSRFIRIKDDSQGPGFKPTLIQLVRLGGQVYVRCDANPWPLDDLMAVPEY